MMMKLSTILLLLLASTLASSCVSEKKPPKKDDSAELAKYVIDAVPQGIQTLNVQFDGKVTLVGYKLKSKGALKPGDNVSYEMYWRVDKELGEPGWKLFTHVLNEKNKRILNIDGVGPLRDYKKSKNQALPPSDWKVGKVYVDEQTFTIPKSVSGGKVRVITGIWKGKTRLKVSKGQKVGTTRAIVLTLPVGGKAKKEKEETVPELRVDRLAKGEKIKIDGKLDEPAWKAAATTGAFVNVKTGKPDPESAVSGSAKLTWDDDNLYLGFEVKDKDLVGGFDKGAKDPHLWTKDTVEVMIDPDGDGDNKDYYEIQVSPQNLVFDSQFDDYNKPNGGKEGPFGHEDWSAKLESAVSLDGTLDKPGDEDKGYTVEMRIPFKSLSKAKTTPPELGQTWRMNMYAMQNNGGVAWSPILGQGNFHKASRFGRVLFAEKGWEPLKQDVGPSPSASGMVDSEAVKNAVNKLSEKGTAKEAASAKGKEAKMPPSPPTPQPLPPTAAPPGTTK